MENKMSEKQDEINTIQINGETYIKQGAGIAEKVGGLEYVIVRCRDAGVHSGYLKWEKDNTVTLIESRRLWRWHGKTLSGLAMEGTTNKEKCKYADTLPEIRLNGWCEIIPCSEEGKTSIITMKAWKNE